MEPLPDTIPLIDPNRLYTAREIGELFKVNASQPVRWARRKHFAAAQTEPLRVKGSELIAYWPSRQKKLNTPHSGVLAMDRSGNAKLGRAAATYVARQSCPDTCPFRQDGCYAEHDNTRTNWDRITAGSAGKSPLDLARTEAEEIDRMPGDRDLRLHVAGDSVTEEGTRLIAAACGRYVQRGAKLGLSVRAWGYTHGWKLVPRDAWGGVSILASCETAEDVRLAHSLGYAAALVVPEFDSDAAFPLAGADGAKILPCPQQTREKTCTDCRLCFADARLRERRLVIGFAIHGWGSNKARRALNRVSLPVIPEKKAA